MKGKPSNLKIEAGSYFVMLISLSVGVSEGTVNECEVGATAVVLA
jgi:hypothetical protein